MNADTIIGIDVGTSSLKATVIDMNGIVLKNMRLDYERNEISPGVVPSTVYETKLVEVLDIISEEYNIISVGISSQMYSLCEVTTSGTLIHQWNSIWARDKKIEPWLEEMMANSGCPVDTMYPAYKLATAKDKKRKFLPYGLKEHLIKFLTGKLTTDLTCASGSGLLDIYAKKWNTAFINALGFAEKDMPQLESHNTPVGNIKVSGKNFTGDNIVVAPALGDGMSASYACIDISKLCVNIGTSLAARAFVGEEEIKEKNRYLWTFAVDEKSYIRGGISSNGCSVLNWAQTIGLSGGEDTGQNDKVMFFPWLHGERTPYWSSNLKGSFIGIEIDTSLSSLTNAIVKGVGYTVVNLIELVSRNMSSDDIAVLAGGGVHSKSLLDVIKGAIPMKIGILENGDYLAAYGAAISASEALGLMVKKQEVVKRVIEPDFRLRNDYEVWLKYGKELNRFYENNEIKSKED